MRKIFAFLGLLALAACGGTGTDSTNSAGSKLFAPTASAIAASAELNNALGILRSGTWSADESDDDSTPDTTDTPDTPDMVTVDDPIPVSESPVAPLTGTATMTGTYQATLIDGIGSGANPADATIESSNGPFAMTVEFDTGLVSGRASDGNFTVARTAGTSVAEDFSGDVTYRGLSGNFLGELTIDDARADFAGETTTQGFFGVFEASRN